MKRLTLKDALIKCRDMWNWLADNRALRKNEYFTENRTGRERPAHDCYACEYTIQVAGGKKCCMCPLFNLWPAKEGRGHTDYTVRCMRESSPYRLWFEEHCIARNATAGSDYERAISRMVQYARIIADACTKELEKLGMYAKAAKAVLKEEPSVGNYCDTCKYSRKGKKYKFGRGCVEPEYVAAKRRNDPVAVTCTWTSDPALPPSKWKPKPKRKAKK